MSKDLGISTAYGYAVSRGYTGTEEEFAELMASYAHVAEDARASAETASNAKDDAVSAKNTAVTSAQTASSKASEAAQSAQNASTSASTASTKASEASASASNAQTSASTASTKATEAASSATAANSAKTDAVAAKNAAQAAQTASETARTAAETAASSVSGSAAQIETNKNDITDLKTEINTSMLPAKYDYSFHGYINATAGDYYANESYRATDFIKCSPGTVVMLKDIVTYTSSLAYAFYDSVKTYISGQNSLTGDVILTTIPENAVYVRFSTELTTNTPECYVFNEKVIETELTQLQSLIDNGGIEPKNTSFFEGVNYFNPSYATLYTDRYIGVNGVVTFSTDSRTLVYPVKQNTTYVIYIPNSDRGIVAESANDNFAYGQTKTPLYTGGHPDNGQITFTTGSSAQYVGIYFNSSYYDWDANKNEIVLNIDRFNGDNPPYIGPQYIPTISDVLNDKNVLIFGDSITDCCAFTINSNKETTAYSWNDPSNSYINAQNVRINYSMWPKILKENQNFKEIRNYAFSGASYKTLARGAGNERQNVQYQIDVAMNDLDNPHNVFSVNDFVPDIVIFALGTNDGAPNDTYESAMSETVYSGRSIDTAATMAALDETKTIASARKAFMRIKQAFPMAQIFCVMPIQRADNDTNLGTLHEYLKQMARRYGCIIIDGTFDSGITRDFNVSGGLGVYLKDGLHPNEKGQNLMARMILTSLKANFVPFGIGFNE